MKEQPPSAASPNRQLLFFVAGILFSFLWASAATATKIALQAGQPLMICIARFFTGGLVMIFIAHGIMKKRMPQKSEWKRLAVYGLLNISIYLGIYVLAMQFLSPGISAISIATNPVIISVISALFFRQQIRLLTWVSLGLCAIGVGVAAWPLLQNSQATPGGLILLLISMFSYSAGILYFSRTKWNDLHNLTINGWSTLLGGLFLLPAAAFTFEPSKNSWDLRFTGSVLWLAIAVSLIGVQIWLYMLKDNPVKASFWLFLCPVFGYLTAHFVMGDEITMYTGIGMALVLVGLYMVQRKKQI